jgi:hypothetical protein
VNGRQWSQLLVAAIVAATAVWIAMHTYWDYVTVDNPPQGNAVGNRFYSFEQLTQRFAIHTRQVPTLRTLPPADSVLLIDDVRGTLLDVDALEKWITAGGRLLVSPYTLLSNQRLRAWSGIGTALPRSVDEDRPALPLKQMPLKPASPDDDCAPYTEHIAGHETGRSPRACLGKRRIAFSSTRIPAWSLSNGYGFQMLRVNIGKGSIALIACECLIGNRSLLRADHARIVFDSIPLKAGDQVEILNPVSAEKLLPLLWRLAAAAIVCALIAIALTLWRNLPRFGRIAVPPQPLRRSLAEQIRATARFAWRTRSVASLRRSERQALTQVASVRLAFFGRMDAAQRTDALAARTGFAAGTLRDALSENSDGSAESQRAAIMLLEKVRRQLIN